MLDGTISKQQTNDKKSDYNLFVNQGMAIWNLACCSYAMS